MGVIRGGLLVIVSFLLFLSFLAGNILLTLDLSLSYDNVHPQLVSIVQDLAEKEMDLRGVVNSKFEFMQEYCQNKSEYVFSAEGHTFAIPCDVVYQGQDKIIMQGIDDFVYRTYYKSYECDFWDCISKEAQPFVLISKKAKDYWHSKFYFVLIASIVLLVLMFLLVEHKPNLLIVAGSLLIVSSIIFRKIDWLASFFGDSFSQFFYIFFSQVNTVFLISLITGIVALGLGIVFRFLAWDFIKKKFSKKEVQEIVKKEVSKSKEEVKKEDKAKKKK